VILIGNGGTGISHNLHRGAGLNNAPDLVHVLLNEGSLHFLFEHGRFPIIESEVMTMSVNMHYHI
jgi:hypothetical protein